MAITLTAAQVEHVNTETVGHAGLETLVSGMGELHDLRHTLLHLMDDATCSRSLLRGFLVLAAFPSDGSEREVTAVARELGLSASTAYRYVRTLTETGLLEQNPQSRRYRRPRSATQAAKASPR